MIKSVLFSKKTGELVLAVYEDFSVVYTRYCLVNGASQSETKRSLVEVYREMIHVLEWKTWKGNETINVSDFEPMLEFRAIEDEWCALSVYCDTPTRQFVNENSDFKLPTYIVNWAKEDNLWAKVINFYGYECRIWGKSIEDISRKIRNGEFPASTMILGSVPVYTAPRFKDGSGAEFVGNASSWSRQEQREHVRKIEMTQEPPRDYTLDEKRMMAGERKCRHCGELDCRCTSY